MAILIGGLDIETTGLDQEKGHRIVEVALLLYQMDRNGIAYRGKYVQRINPQRSIDPGAFAVHGISFEDVCMCPTINEVAPKLVKLLDACDLIVAHNGNGFDLPFLTAELVRIGSRIPDVQSVDTMLQARWATPMGKLPNLGELCFACGVEYDVAKAHAAEYDVSVMMECFFKAYKTGFITLPELKKERLAA